MGKSYCYVSAYKWTNGKWGFKSIRESPGTICIRGDGRNLKEIPRLRHDEATEALGFWQALNGSMKKETEVMEEKIKTWTTNVCQSTRP